MVECFAVLIIYGLQKGGIRETFLPDDSISGGNLVWQEQLIDLLFFSFIILIALNLILGLLIDTLAEMRTKAALDEALIKQRCFICDLTKADFLSANKSWVDHVSKEHNVFSYIYFILYLQKKESDGTMQLSTLEKYVLEKLNR